jgi:hypothetical protein
MRDEIDTFDHFEVSDRHRCKNRLRRRLTFDVVTCAPTKEMVSDSSYRLLLNTFPRSRWVELSKSARLTLLARSRLSCRLCQTTSASQMAFVRYCVEKRIDLAVSDLPLHAL